MLPQLIGMVHLLPLPGAPRFNGSMDEVIQRAVQDAMAIETGGFDGLMIENYGDVPFHRTVVGPETVSAMTRVALEVRRATSVPIGINVLRNDPIAAIGIAAVVGASFVRVNVHVGAVVADQGIIEGDARATLGARTRLGADVAILADAHVKHAQPVAPRSIEEEAADIIERGCADGVIVSGMRTGAPCDVNALRAVRNTIDAPLFAGSGVTAENVNVVLDICHGAIIGTSLKRNGVVDQTIVENLVRLVRARA